MFLLKDLLDDFELKAHVLAELLVLHHQKFEADHYELLIQSERTKHARFLNAFILLSVLLKAFILLFFIIQVFYLLLLLFIFFPVLIGSNFKEKLILEFKILKLEVY